MTDSKRRDPPNEAMQWILLAAKPLIFTLTLDKPEGMTNGNTGGKNMSTAKIAISISEEMLKQLDDLVREETFPSRSGAIQKAVHDFLDRQYGNRLARECAKLDPEEEMAIAEEGMNSELGSWPEY